MNITIRAKLDTLMKLAEEQLQPFGWSVIDARWLARESRLQFFLDGREAPPGLDELATASRHIDEVSEEWMKRVGLGSDGFTLEVSSPGLDRPIRRREDLERFGGQQVRVIPEGGRRKSFDGALKVCTEGHELEGDPEILVNSDDNVLVWQGRLSQLLGIDLVYNWVNEEVGING